MQNQSVAKRSNILNGNRGMSAKKRLPPSAFRLPEDSAAKTESPAGAPDSKTAGS